jgi:hypothetical protein
MDAESEALTQALREHGIESIPKDTAPGIASALVWNKEATYSFPSRAYLRGHWPGVGVFLFSIHAMFKGGFRLHGFTIPHSIGHLFTTQEEAKLGAETQLRTFVINAMKALHLDTK